MKKPYYWRARKGWYLDTVTPEGKHSQVRLADKKTQAFDIWEKMRLKTTRSLDSQLFSVTVEAWLKWTAQQVEIGARSQIYLETVGRNMALFLSSCPEITVEELTPARIMDWLATRKWANDTKATFIGHVQTILHWAAKNKLIADGSGMDDCEVPRKRRRETVADESIYRTMFAMARSRHRKIDRRFALFLLLLWRTGARPGEIAKLRIQEVDFDRSCWIQAEHKTANKTKRSRIVYLDACALTAVKLLSNGRSEGVVFLGKDGQMTRNAIRIRMQRLRIACNLDQKIVAYSFRHGFATQALAQGLSVPVVAQLLGHTSGQMVERVYGHIDKRVDLLHAELAKVNKPKE